jgi:ribosomal protein L17
MNKDYEYFKEFLDNPAPYSNNEFHSKLRDWAEYIKARADEFNYLEDDEWKEIRERIIEEIGRREDIRAEFEELDWLLETIEKFGSTARIKVYNRWLSFMKNNQLEYDFTDEQIAELEASLESLIHAERRCEITGQKVLMAKINYRKSIEKLDDDLAEYYEKTGKTPVLTSLPLKKKIKGN